jgi:hypothetical protein
MGFVLFSYLLLLRSEAKQCMTCKEPFTFMNRKVADCCFSWFCCPIRVHPVQSRVYLSRVAV